MSDKVVTLVPRKPSEDNREAMKRVLEFIDLWRERAEREELIALAIIGVGTDNGINFQIENSGHKFAALIAGCELLKRDIIDTVLLERETS